MNKVSPIVTELEQRVIDTANHRLTANEVAKLADTTRESVYRIAIKYGLKIKLVRLSLTPKQEDKLRSLASYQLSIKDLEKKTGISKWKVTKFLNDNSLPRKEIGYQIPEPVKSGKDVFCWEDYENRLF